MKNGIKIILAVLIFLLGLYIGRNNYSPSDPMIKYLPGDIITDSIPYPEPYEVLVTKYVKLPTIIDTVFVNGDTVFVESVDTVAIVNDYALKRNYKEVLFDNDTVGYLMVNSSVQYNKMASMGYKFSPVTKQIELIKEPLFTPYIIGTYSNLGYVGIGGGIYIKNFGVQLKYLNNLELSNQGWEFGIVRSF